MARETRPHTGANQHASLLHAGTESSSEHAAGETRRIDTKGADRARVPNTPTQRSSQLVIPETPEVPSASEAKTHANASASASRETPLTACSSEGPITNPWPKFRVVEPALTIRKAGHDDADDTNDRAPASLEQTGLEHFAYLLACPSTTESTARYSRYAPEHQPLFYPDHAIDACQTANELPHVIGQRPAAAKSAKALSPTSAKRTSAIRGAPPCPNRPVKERSITQASLPLPLVGRTSPVKDYALPTRSLGIGRYQRTTQPHVKEQDKTVTSPQANRPSTSIPPKPGLLRSVGHVHTSESPHTFKLYRFASEEIRARCEGEHPEFHTTLSSLASSSNPAPTIGEIQKLTVAASHKQKAKKSALRLQATTSTEHRLVSGLDKEQPSTLPQGKQAQSDDPHFNPFVRSTLRQPLRILDYDLGAKRMTSFNNTLFDTRQPSIETMTDAEKARKIAEIKARPSRKSYFGKDHKLAHKRRYGLHDIHDENMGACKPDFTKPDEYELRRHEDGAQNLKEALNLPENAIPMNDGNTELSFRDGTLVNGKLPRPRTTYKVGKMFGGEPTIRFG